MSDDTNDLLVRLYSLSNELPVEKFQNAALALIKPVVPFDAAIWGTASTGANGIDIHSFFLHNKTPDMVAEYEGVKHLDSASSAMFDTQRATRAFHTNSFFESRDKRAIRNFMTKFEQPHFLLCTDLKAQSHGASSLLHWITLYRAKQDAHYATKDVGRLHMFAPHFKQALALNRMLHLGKAAVVGGRSSSPFATGIADIKGNLYGHEANFFALISNACGEDHANTTQLPTSLTAKLMQAKKTFLWQNLAVRCHAEHGLIILKLREQTRADTLTAREREIALLIAEGRTYKQVALTLGKATGTVRNQIQTIYSKLLVNNIAELITAIRDAY